VIFRPSAYIVTRQLTVQFFTFDVIGDLAFAESFGCLEQSKYHPWIDFAFESLVMATLMRAMDYYPLFKRFAMMMVSHAALDGARAHVEFIKQKAMHRLSLPEGRPDLMSKMAAKDSGISREEFISSSDTVLLGGSETSGTLLSGLTYFLLKNPRVLQKLVHEIRSKFQCEEDINFTGVNSLDYMLACIDEAFRLYPPVPAALLRKTREGDVICGQYVPPNVRLSVFLPEMTRLG
jgi:cytochrome P450